MATIQAPQSRQTGAAASSATEDAELSEWREAASTGLFEHFKKVASKTPTALAIVDGHSRLTYEALVARVEAFGEKLRATGIGPHDQAAVILGNNAGFVIAVLAAWKIGAVVIPLNPQMREEEFLRYFLDSHPSVLITDAKKSHLGPFLTTKGASVAHTWLYRSTDGEWLDEPVTDHKTDGEGVRVPLTDPAPNCPALTQYSTGSTGTPKRVTRTHGQLLGEFLSVATVFQFTTADRVLGVIPFFHSHGLKNAAMLPLFTGATLYAVDYFLPRDVARLIVREKITFFPGIPFMFQQLAAAKERYDLSSLRWVFSGAAPLAQATVQAFENAYSIRLRQVYGTTETGLICVQREPTDFDGFNRVGSPIPGVILHIVDDDGRQVSEGAEGRIEVMSAFAPSKYDNSAGNSECHFAGDSYFPGDIGRLSASGQLILSGRHRGFINVGGNKVDPAEIEAALLEHPAISEAAVIGVNHPDSGEMVKAVIVASAALSNSDIRAHLLQRLAEYKHPRQIEFRKELPKSPLGKVQRKSLMAGPSET